MPQRRSAPTRRVATKQPTSLSLPGGHEVLLTRRHFLYGVAGVAALAAVGGGAAWAAGRSGDDDALKTLKVPESAVTAQTDLEEMENYEDAVTLAGSAKLPFGTLVWCSDDAVAACLLPTETAKPLAEVGLLDLSSAECTTIIEHAVGEAEGFEIYDVRANSAGVVWTEADILDNVWRVYAASLSGTTLGEPQLLDEGDVNARVEDSRLLRAAFGTTDSQVVYASQGRMACAPTSCGDSLALAPRARTSGTYYQLTHLDAATGEVTDACVLPSSMKPMECGWGKTGFSFAFDGIYSYGEGIANLGTYLPMEAPAAVSLTAANTEEMASEGGEADGGAPYLPVTCANPGTEAYSAVPWFHFAANPLSAPCWCGDWLMVRGGSLVVAIDLAGRRYAKLPLEEGSGDYNDFLASTHMGTRAVTYCNVDYTPIGGEQQKHCLVRIWEPAA